MFRTGGGAPRRDRHRGLRSDEVRRAVGTCSPFLLIRVLSYRPCRANGAACPHSCEDAPMRLQQLAPKSRKSSSNLNERRDGWKARFETLEPRAMMAGDAIMHWNAIALQAEADDKSGTFGSADAAGP